MTTSSKTGVISALRLESAFIIGAGGASDDGGGHGQLEPNSVPYLAVFLVLTMLPNVLLSKKLAVLVDHGIATLGTPAARANKLQRSVNLSSGSALATIGFTVPAVLAFDLFTGMDVVLGLEGNHLVLLVLTLVVSILTFGGVRTNSLQGAVHLVVFLVYLVLIFNP